MSDDRPRRRPGPPGGSPWTPTLARGALDAAGFVSARLREPDWQEGDPEQRVYVLYRHDGLPADTPIPVDTVTTDPTFVGEYALSVIFAQIQRGERAKEAAA